MQTTSRESGELLKDHKLIELPKDIKLITPLSGESFRLLVRSEGQHSTPAITRLRHALKALLRQHGLRVVEAVPVLSAGMQEPHSEDQADELS